MDNAKIFSQLMSKSRSLAKISDRRLQPLLVCAVIDSKLPKGGGAGAWYHAASLCAPPMITST